MPKSHDIFFREEFSKRENIIDFIEGTFPEKILSKLNLSTLSNSSSSYTDEELKEYFSDIVYTCKSEDKEVVISLLFEHKSYPVPFPHLQLLKYKSKIWELGIKQTGKPTQVIPVILYHGREPWKKRGMADYFDGYDEAFGSFLPQFDYLLIDLSQFSNDEIKGVVFKKAALKITLLMMKNIFHEEELERNLADYLEIGRLYFEEEKGLKFLESIVRYLYKSTNIEVDKVISETKTISERGGEVTMTTAMRLIEQGKKEGRIEGEKEGELKGELKGALKGE